MIPLFDYQRQWRERQSEILDTIQRVLDSGQLILGAEGRAFESALAKLVGVEHGIGVNSVTDALVLALRVLGSAPVMASSPCLIRGANRWRPMHRGSASGLC